MTTTKRYHQGNPIRWYGGKPPRFARIPNELGRDLSLGAWARSVALLLYTHADGYEVSDKNLATEFGCSRNTIASARRELEAGRWLVVRRHETDTGKRIFDEFYLHTTRKFSEAEAVEIGRSVVLGAQNLSTPMRQNEAPPCSDTEHPPAQNLSTKEDQQEDQREDQREDQVTTTSDLDIQARKRALRPEIRQLVDTIIPATYNRNHLTNVAVKAAVELDVTNDTIAAALNEWLEDHGANPGRLRSLIEDQQQNDPVTVIRRCLDDPKVDVTPLRRFGMYFSAPDLPITIKNAKEAGVFMRAAKAEWLREQLSKYETNERKTTAG
jgi:hypothetical protein